MRKAVLSLFMVFLVFGMLLHSPLTLADEDNNSGTSINSSTNVSVNSNSGRDDDDDDENETEDDEDEINDSDEDDDDNENETGDDSDEDDRRDKNRTRERSREILREGNCTIKIEREIKLENGKRVEVVKRKIVCDDGTRSEIKIRIENRTFNGEFRERIKYEREGEELEVEAEEGIEFEEDTNGTEYKIKARLRNGNTTNIKIMPDRAHEIALERLRALNITIELVEVGQGNNNSRVFYLAKVYKDGRFLGIFKLKMKLEGQIDPETGEVVKIRKPWWAVFVAGEDSEQTGEVEAESETEVNGS